MEKKKKTNKKKTAVKKTPKVKTEVVKEKPATKEIKTKQKIEVEARKQSTAFFVIIAIFVLLILLGVIASQNLKSAYGASTYQIKFLGDTGYSIYDNGHYVAPVNDTCETDEYGYLDPECAHTVACICRRWSTTKSGKWPSGCVSVSSSDESKKCSCNDAEGVPCQATALYNSAMYTTRFTGGSTYYCVYGSSYASGCDVPAPVTSCYVCEGGSGPVKTINETRAATMTGVTDSSKCHAVADEECEPNPSTTPATTTPPTTTPPTTTPPTTTPPTTTPPTTTPPTTTPPTAAPSDNCYSCTLGIGKEYVYAKSKEEAANKSGGTNCTTIDKNYCNNPQKNCYSCDKNGTKEYTYTTTVDRAKAIIGGTNCSIVKSSYCEIVPVNPPTSSAKTVVALIVGFGALICSVVYFVKIK